MKLKPSTPPGNRKRKLLAALSEVYRLRDEGYSISVIHECLRDAGIEASWATVQRELARRMRPTPTKEKPTKPRKTKPLKTGESAATDLDTFFAPSNTNPLFTRKVK